MTEPTFELIAPCHFGLESVLKREITDLGYEIVQVEDGKVTFRGDAGAICRANVFFAHGGAGAHQGRKLSGDEL